MSPTTPLGPRLAPYLLAAALLAAACAVPAGTPKEPDPEGSPPSSEARLLTFVFLAEDNAPSLGVDYWAADPGGGGLDLVVADLPSTADLASLVASFTLSPGARAYVSGVEQVSGLSDNDFRVPLSFAVVAEDGTEAVYRITVTLAPAPRLSISACALSPAVLGPGSEGAGFRLEVSVGGLDGAAVTTVTADLGAIGGPPAADLSPAPSGRWSLAATLGPGLEPGDYPVTVTAHDRGLGLEASAQALLVIRNPAFTGGDFEAGGPPGLPATCHLETASAFEGGASLRYTATPLTSATVAVGTARFTPRGSFTKLVFWFRGRAGGTAPGLRVQLGSGGSNRCYYDLNALTCGQDLRVAPSAGGTYATRAIDCPEWTRVILDLTDLSVSAVAGDDLANYVFQFRVRAGGDHDWQVDYLHYE